MKTKFLLLLLFVFNISGLAQSSKTHYIPPLSDTPSYQTLDQYLYISCSSTTDITYKLTPIGGTPIVGTVRRDNPQAILIGNGSGTQILANNALVSTILNDKGYIVEAEDLVYVTVRLISGSGNHAGGLVSKGLAALGTQFRVGAFTNREVGVTDGRHYTFVSILATENNTTISFSDIKPGVVLLNNPGGSSPASVNLNAGQSYILAVQGATDANRDGLVGMLVSSTKPIAVNCGSFGGTNGVATNSTDVGFDQIVSAERTGKEYIFIAGDGGSSTIERPLIIAHTNNTQVFLNGSATPATTLNAGQYYALDGSAYTAQGNLYVRTSENVFAYQGLGSSDANQNLQFLPPLSCETPKIIDNIPFIDTIGGTQFSGNVCVVTETGANITFLINGVNYTLATLGGIGVTFTGPNAVAGNPNFVTYKFSNMTGNVSLFSDKSVYLSYYGESGAATYGGFYSGFTYKPEITFNNIAAGTSNDCIPNVKLAVNATSSFDTFQWFFNGNPIPGATANNYIPTAPGFYKVRGSISYCPLVPALESVDIPVSSCPTDLDNDSVNDNIDIDRDNDGITNCVESFGNQIINTAVVSGTIPSSTITYTAATSNSIPAATQPFVGNTDGSFVTSIPPGKNYYVDYTLTFGTPTNVRVEYPTTAASTDLLNVNAEYKINADTNKTITVLNPTNQLLIDTNYDGIYESGVTQFSSFEIRFRINGVVPIAAGTGTFSFQSYQTTSLKITHINLVDTLDNKSTFKVLAFCVPNNTDGDSLANQDDVDSDGDTIPDTIEAQGNTVVVLANADTNGDGLDNAFEPGFTPIDSDTDSVVDYLDLDTDNDGILDSHEGIIDTDADGIKNFRELDSDNDLCYDVKEAGFLDPDNDGFLGNTPVTTNTSGLVTSGVGYTAPNVAYTTYAPIVITTQPQVAPTCHLQATTITLVDNGGNTYQWQVSTDGITWNNLTNVAPYSNVTTGTLTINPVNNSMNGYKYRVILNKTGNVCGLTSAETTLTVYPLPTVNPVTIVQCDNNLDLISDFNLTIKNDQISANFASETFTYYRTLAGANTADATQLISNELAFTNTTTPMNVWARVINSNGCFSVAQLTLIVSATQIPQTYFYTVPPVCDDTLAADGTVTGDPEVNKRDGISSFDLTAAMLDVQAQLPPPLSNYDIKYYRNQADALAQTVNGVSLAIPPSEYTNFRNDIPNAQNIWVRVNSTLLGGCPGFGEFIRLSVEELPYANPVTDYKFCDDDQDGVLAFNTSSLETTLIGTNQSGIPYTISYFEADGVTPLRDNNGVLITSPFPASFATTTKDIVAVITNNTTRACFDRTTIKFIVDDLPKIGTLTSTITTLCDDELEPSLQDGVVIFDTTNFETELLNGQSLTNFEIKYYESDGVTPLTDVNGLAMISPFPATFETASKTIKVVLTNKVNTTCPDILDVVFTVNALPNIDLVGDDEIVCTNLPTFNVALNAGITDGTPTTDYTYQWYQDGNQLVNETNYTYNANVAGVYTVVVENANGCKRTRSITVIASIEATILAETIVELVDENSITVNVTGGGNYVFSLDEEFGPFQESNYFANVQAGEHTIYVKDMNGCGTVSKVVYVLGTPKYFTPNGDGFNDYWNVKGVSSVYNANTKIFIFDRYGKLLKQISPLDKGWDGTYLGNQMPASDYWFTVEFEDGRTVKSHFALKR